MNEYVNEYTIYIYIYNEFLLLMLKKVRYRILYKGRSWFIFKERIRSVMKEMITSE